MNEDRVSVLQNERGSGECLHHGVHVPNTTELCVHLKSFGEFHVMYL